ncbi:hypothetical protein KDW_52260 [Dictyobacter vulcani]|uniref:Uncharacterized protein n=1 Tax=Dictyobacter vulcani TaxID=2607529 RepID=A0A5J4KNX0_9CHLR|nr:HEAT repeat domain-containing protein [Dictyobacter vulcani]GER91064.1 hypothetical protein KDW_52260 [Dictyobacter vulcani]
MEKNDSDHQEEPEALSLYRQFERGEKRQDAELRLPPLTYLGLGLVPESPLAVEQLRAHLRHADWTVRVEALRQLERCKEPLPITDILICLQDEHKAVRAAAIRLLDKSGDTIPLDPLLTALYDPDWHVRSRAVMALGNHLQHAPLDPLLYALGDQDEAVRSAAVTALGKLGEQTPLEYIVAALQDPSWMVREAAGMVLAESGQLASGGSLPGAMTDQGQHVTHPSEPVALLMASPVHHHFWSLSALAVRIKHFRPAKRAISAAISVVCIIALLCAVRSPLTAPATLTPIVDQIHYYAVTGGSARITWLGNSQFAWADEHGAVRVANTLLRQATTLYRTPARILDLARVNNSFYTVEYQDDTVSVRKDNQQTVFALPTSSQIPTAFFSPDGKYVALALNEPGAITTITIWNTLTGRQLSSYTAQQGTITNISWPATGNVLASVSTAIDRSGQRSWKIEMWDMRTGQSVLTRAPTTYMNLSQQVVALSWSPDDTRLAYTLADGVVHIHDRITLIDGSYNARSVASSDWDGAISWSPDGRYLAATNVNGHVEIWDVSGDNNDGHLVCTYLRHKTPVQSVVWAPKSSIDRIASTDASGNLFIWDVQGN